MEEDVVTSRGRPRDEARDAQILHSALDVLREVGYDRLTMESVAGRAKAGKATLYRRWTSKADLVVDAILLWDGESGLLEGEVDTGTLRGDLLGHCCGASALIDPRTLSITAGLITAMHHDRELASVFQERFVAVRQRRLGVVFERARRRGEVHPHADVELLAKTIPGHVFFRLLCDPRPVDEDFVVRVVDSIVLPAAAAGPHQTSTTSVQERHDHQ